MPLITPPRWPEPVGAPAVTPGWPAKWPRMKSRRQSESVRLQPAATAAFQYLPFTGVVAVVDVSVSVTAPA
jgi:hypothetical protein